MFKEIDLSSYVNNTRMILDMHNGSFPSFETVKNECKDLAPIELQVLSEEYTDDVICALIVDAITMDQALKFYKETLDSMDSLQSSEKLENHINYRISISLMCMRS